MPTHSPELPSAYYRIEEIVIDHGPSPGRFLHTTIEYHEPVDDGYAYDPDASGELDWETENLDNVEATIGSSDGKREITVVILTHRLGHAPDADEFELFEPICADWSDGQGETVVSVDKLDAAGLRT